MSVTLDVFQRRLAQGGRVTSEDLQELRRLLDQAHLDAAKLLETLETEELSER